LILEAELDNFCLAFLHLIIEILFFEKDFKTLSYKYFTIY